MKAPAVPENEASRLAALRGLNILDTPPEERFDRLTRMAKKMFGVPIALVSLVDDNRQWFKSNMGLKVNETPRDISFCGHAILNEDIFIVPDATADDRFCDNPLVVDDPHYRFYAGCPLKYLDGSILGTLCIVDREPRTLEEEDLLALADLARTVEGEFAAVKAATMDELTKVLNRRGFLKLAKHCLLLCIRQKLPVSLAFLDLNDFKPINDTFGHAEGDKVLFDFADRLRNLCRESDLFARLGGDEFAVLFFDATKEDSETIIERFNRAIDKYNAEKERGYSVSFSYGIVEFDLPRHEGIEGLLEEADRLMYESKKRGKITG